MAWDSELVANTHTFSYAFFTKINSKLVVKLTNNTCNWRRDLSHLKVPSLIFSTFSQRFEILVLKDGPYFSHCPPAFLQPKSVSLGS